jgi:hypothetical protein
MLLAECEDRDDGRALGSWSPRVSITNSGCLMFPIVKFEPDVTRDVLLIRDREGHQVLVKLAEPHVGAPLKMSLYNGR